jgi:hypothetical protein
MRARIPLAAVVVSGSIEVCNQARTQPKEKNDKSTGTDDMADKPATRTALISTLQGVRRDSAGARCRNSLLLLKAVLGIAHAIFPA